MLKVIKIKENFKEMFIPKDEGFKINILQYMNSIVYYTTVG